MRNFQNTLNDNSFDYTGLKLEYIEKLQTLFLNNNKVYFDYKKEYQLACENTDLFSERAFNKKILKLASQYNFKHNSVSKNGHRYYILFK
jgi:hypothetical protein